MRKILFFTLIIAFFTVACQSQNGNGSSEVLSVADYKTQIAAEGIQLVDVRTPQEYEAGYIGEAVNIDFLNDNFATEIQQLDKTKPVYIYCRSGNRSARAAQQMQELGFREVYDLKGGYRAWSAQR
jgi:rhodanese-related sulfurtransferase